MPIFPAKCHIFAAAHPAVYDPQIRTRLSFCTMHLPPGFIIILCLLIRKLSCWQKDTQTNKQMLLKTSKALHYATTLGNHQDIQHMRQQIQNMRLAARLLDCLLEWPLHTEVDIKSMICGRTSSGRSDSISSRNVQCCLFPPNLQIQQLLSPSLSYVKPNHTLTLRVINPLKGRCVTSCVQWLHFAILI